jgi:hypothetical protein
MYLSRNGHSSLNGRAVSDSGAQAPMVSHGQWEEPMPTQETVEAPSRVLCLVPDEVPGEVIRCLEQHFARTGVITRVTHGRRSDRRSGGERRDEVVPAPPSQERRLAPELEARRFGERRGRYELVDAPILPTPAVPYADKLRFVRRRPRAADERELVRLRGLAHGWRERARVHEREATGLLRSLIGAVEDLRQLRTLTPRWFLAVRRGDQAIAEYRDRHVTR